MLISIFILLLALYLARTILTQVFIVILVVLNVLFGIFDFELFFSPFGYYVLVSNLFLLLTLISLNINSHRDVKSNINKSGKSDYLSSILPLVTMIFVISVILDFKILGGTWTEVRGFNNKHPILWMIFLILFFYSCASISQKPWTYKEALHRLIRSSPLVFIVILLKIKIFIIPIVYMIGVHGRSRKIKLAHIVFGVALFICLYFLIMIARWSPEGELTLSTLITTIQNVLNAGFEREMKLQATEVFNYFYYTNDFLGPVVLERIVLKPFEMLFSLSIVPENPIYIYNQIVYGYSDGFSSHPSIYSDSFAKYGYFGLVFPSLIMVLLNFVEKRIHVWPMSGLLGVGLILFLVLMSRGSFFYGALYLAISIILTLPIIFLRNIKKYAYHKKQP